MEDIQLQIIQEDIDHANSKRSAQIGLFDCATPACAAMSRITDSNWHTVGAMILVEDEAPFRFCTLPLELNKLLENFCPTGEMEPCSFIVTLRKIEPARAKFMLDFPDFPKFPVYGSSPHEAG